MANRNWSNGGKLYQMETSPVLITCNFIVDSANGNGLGIRSLKGAGVTAVYMTTSATKAPLSPGGTTGPAAGTIVVQLDDNYNRSLAGFNSIISPVSGSAVKIDNSALTQGVAYIITTLDAAITPAMWQTLGVPAGVTPAVGVSFIAALVGLAGEANTSSARVMASAAAGSGIFMIETVGDPNQSIAPLASANQGFGAQFILQCRKDSSSDASVIAAPADNTVIALAFLLSNSSVSVLGQ
jgi:hypothetical protein